MTDAAMPSNASNPSQGVGVSPENEGLILQRGGEELALEKAGDRFTVRLTDSQALDLLTQQIQPIEVTSISSMELVELQVDSSQLEQAMQIARSFNQVTFASHVYRLQNSPNTLVYLTDEVTVQFTQMEQTEAEPIAASLGLQTIRPVAGIPHAFVFHVTDQARLNPIKLANQLMRRADVLTAEPNVAIKTLTLYRPRDTDYPQQWYLNNGGGGDLAPGSHIFVEAAWDITRGSRSVVVAVADDAFDLNHPDFQGQGKIIAPRNFKEVGALPLPGSPQENHGTACAGLAIAEENNVGIVGVAPGCSFMPIRTTGFLDDNAIEQIFDWATDHGAWVISCSWGPSLVYYSLTLRQKAAINRAATKGRGGKGCVVVFAAGNTNRPVNGTIDERGWPQEVLSGATAWLSGFAVHPDVIAVSACTSLNKKAAYSNWGANVSVCAPSNNAIPGMWLQETGYVNAPPLINKPIKGKGVFSTDRLGGAGYDPGSFTTDFGGTSSACPVVAGVAALVLSANPNLTAKEVKQILQDTADKIVDSDPDPQFGYRRGTYDASGHSQWFGYGKVNAAKAVQAAQQKTSRPGVTSRIQQRNTTAMDIPDFNFQGITSGIQINDPGRISDIQISVTIEHSFMGDLEVSLLAPTGDIILLQSRTLGRLTLLQKNYSPQTTSLLGRLLGKPAAGRWLLQVIDFARVNTGRLRSWQIDMGVS
jgi:subtilisin family serine protease